jgi:hypothetical protein
MTTRDEITKIRRELQAAEKALAMSERAKQPVSRNLEPVGLPEKKRPAPNSADIPNFIGLPKKQKRTENKW